MTTTRKVQLAYDVLSMASSASMPDTFWSTDSRILRACEVLGITPAHALKGHYRNEWPTREFLPEPTVAEHAVGIRVIPS